MESSAAYVQPSLIIGRCPLQKHLGLLVHVPAREDAFSKSCLLSTMEAFHSSVVDNRQKDDQLKQWNRHITPSTQGP